MRAADDLEGKRVRCPACRQPVTVPALREKPLVTRKRVKPEEVLDESDENPVPDNVPELEREPARIKRKKKKKKQNIYHRGGGGGDGGIDIFGMRLTVGSGLGLLCVLGLVGGVIYLLVPSYSCHVVEVRAVDVYAALEVGKRNVFEQLIVGEAGHNLLAPGAEKFLIIRDAPEGEMVFVRLELPPKFLAAHADSRQGSLNISSHDFLLQGDGQPVESLILDLERDFTDPARGVTMDFSTAATGNTVLPRDRPPWTPQGEFIKNYQDETVKWKEDFGSRGGFSCSGTGAFKGKRGMEVNYDFQGSTLQLTRDSRSRAYIGNTFQDFIDRFLIERMKVACVFPRPPGKTVTLIVMGVKVGPINPK
jgi:hypothetical protein